LLEREDRLLKAGLYENEAYAWKRMVFLKVKENYQNGKHWASRIFLAVVTRDGLNGG